MTYLYIALGILAVAIWLWLTFRMAQSDLHWEIHSWVCDTEYRVRPSRVRRVLYWPVFAALWVVWWYLTRVERILDLVRDTIEIDA